MSSAPRSTPTLATGTAPTTPAVSPAQRIEGLRITVIDNYDSFTHNVVAALQIAGAHCTVVMNDEISLQELLDADNDGFVISPGPCTPARSGLCLPLIAALSKRSDKRPLLGICLGYQALAVQAGGRIVRDNHPQHGKQVRIRHDGKGVFAGLGTQLVAARYNSLCVAQPLPGTLEATAWSERGALMAIRHHRLPHVGLQFHPESWLSDCQGLFRNWLALC